MRYASVILSAHAARAGWRARRVAMTDSAMGSFCMMKTPCKFVSMVINHDLRESQGEKFFFANGEDFPGRGRFCIRGFFLENTKILSLFA